jgi:hypothetical protein
LLKRRFGMIFAERGDISLNVGKEPTFSAVPSY